MNPSRPSTDPVVAQIAGAVAGALLLGASFVPWTRRGAGSSIALVRIADLILSGTVDLWVPRVAGLVVYAIPLGGALVLLGTGLGRGVGTAVAAAGVLLALAGTALAGLALDHLPGTAGIGPGAVAAGAGILLGAGRVAAAAATHARDRPRPPA